MNIIIKYIISGGTAAIVDLITLNFLDSLGLHYFFSVNIAFIVAFIVSFSLQKYWTFNDSENKKTHHQLIVYFIVSVSNAFVNTLIIHLLLSYSIVDQLLFMRPVIFAQIISGAIIAFESFIIYRYFIFKKSKKSSNILIITQKLDMDDSYFGFFHDWLIRFSTNCDKVTVISLETYKYNLPSNVKVLSLGKENKNSKINYLYLLYKYSFRESKNYDIVFCHMSPLYVIAGWPVWIILNKKIALWYVHRSVDLKLRIATILAHRIFTATPESFRIKSKKVRYMGQAVSIERFSRIRNKVSDNILKIITVGRITPIKRLEVLIEAVAIVKSKNIPLHLSIVGATVLPEDTIYEDKLKLTIKEKNLDSNISFIGPVPNKDMPEYYQRHDVFVNLSPTGGLDKAVLEAMASEMPVIVSNKAFEMHLDGFVKELLCKESDSTDCAEKLISLYTNKNYNQIGKVLYREVCERSSLNSLISAIIKNINEII